MKVAQLCKRYSEYATDAYASTELNKSLTVAFRLPKTRFTAKCRTPPGVIRRQFGGLEVDEFTPRHLERFRQTLIDGGWKTMSGKVAKPWNMVTINEHVRIAVRLFKWGVRMSYVSPVTLTALQCVEPLKKHRCQVKMPGRVSPVSKEHVEQTLAKLNQPFRDMAILQWYTGMRPGEVIAMTCDGLDTSGDVWFYRPKRHKMDRLGKPRIIAIGPRGINVLRPRLKPNPHEPLFLTKSLISKPLFKYRRAIATAAEAAGIPRWTPHQIRHSRATLVEQRFGREAAANAIGDSIRATDIYAERNLRQMIEVARVMG